MSSAQPATEPPGVEVLSWLKSLPSAPEYHPTLAEFQDPISYILKIEKEASSYGICKIVPPLPPPPKKISISNLNRSFAARDPNPKKPPTFTTRQQQVGFCPRRPRPVQKPVWQSGEHYTLHQFEAKAKQFERSHLKKHSSRAKPPSLSPLELETLFWKACVDKPFSVEYANDMPGSGFAPLVKKWSRDDEAANVGETAWNMRGVSRAKGSLLRFMKEEIPGVTSPMVYVAMLFSWFAWHVEDHELHSLNYLHLGAGKTWYGVPRDAGLAFEEVIRTQGYGGEVNPLVTFTILGEKTTVMSPEVLTSAGIPCCRLVQNAGEFVVTFPGAYHSGFSHGFNCAEAANIATPEWLRVAKEAAIRRASINYPPMVSHFQLLYALALSLCLRMPLSSGAEPRSSRLKDKMRGEGEVMIKEFFVQNVIETNDLLSVLLDKGSTCIVLPQSTSDSPLCSSSLVKTQLKIKPRLSLGLCSREEALEASGNFPPNDVLPGRNVCIEHLSDFCSLEGNSISVCQGKKLTSATRSKSATAAYNSSTSDSQHMDNEKGSAVHGDGLLDQGLLSCVTCGILSFTCVAVVYPRETTARYLMSADCGFLNDHSVLPGENSDSDNGATWKKNTYDLGSGSGETESYIQDRMDENLVHRSGPYSVQVSDHSVEVDSDTAGQKGITALDLLASAYGDSSDSEEEGRQGISICTDENDFNHQATSAADHFVGATCQYALSKGDSQFTAGPGDLYDLKSVSAEDRCQLKVEFSDGNQPENTKSAVLSNLENNREATMSSSSIKPRGEPIDVNCRDLFNSCHTTRISNIHHRDVKKGRGVASDSITLFGQPDACFGSAAPFGNVGNTIQSRNFDTIMKEPTLPVIQKSDKDSSRMHVFCLEHAVEVEKLLRPFGGVNIMLLCHPDYPQIEKEAKLLAEEMESDYVWKEIDFREATEQDEERIRAALEDEESIPTNSDWAVKLGISLYYSANLSKSPLYSKQIPYNAIIYKAFGACSSPNNSPVKPKPAGRILGRQKKLVVAGKWCGKVWMSNQVHPYLARRKETQERELAERLHSHRTPDKKSKEVGSKTECKTLRPRKSGVNSNSAAKKSVRKRRKKPLVRATKKPKCTQEVLDDSTKTPEDTVEDSPAKCGRVLRSCRKSNVKDEAGGPSTRLRRRPPKSEVASANKPTITKKQTEKRKSKKGKAAAATPTTKDVKEEGEYMCNIEGCSMSFGTRQDLALHKKDICPEKGCGKKFFSHKYLVQHRKVHLDERPLECPWKGCKMRFKWAWARTEHIRVHTGDRPYVCRECGQTFRFVSDFSRHKRKTGHLVKKGRR